MDISSQDYLYTIFIRSSKGRYLLINIIYQVHKIKRIIFIIILKFLHTGLLHPFLETRKTCKKVRKSIHFKLDFKIVVLLGKVQLIRVQGSFTTVYTTLRTEWLVTSTYEKQPHISTRKLSILHTTHLAHDIIPLSLLITELDQETTPAELPIFGDPDSDIVLDLVFPKGNTLFSLSGKKLRLLAPLDRDADNLSHIVFQVST